MQEEERIGFQTGDKMKQFVVGDITVELEKKRIKNMYLRVLPPDGRVHISAPVRMKEEDIKGFVLNKMDWIKQQQMKLQSSQRFQTICYQTGDKIYYKGRMVVLIVTEKAGRPGVTEHDNLIEMTIKENSSPEQRKKLLDRWYKEALFRDIIPLLEGWEKTIGVKTSGFTIRDMKTRWGTCNIRTKKVCFNLRLAQKPPECLEYVVVHELVHLLEKSHNRVFKNYLDRFLPQWRSIKKELDTMT